MLERGRATVGFPAANPPRPTVSGKPSNIHSTPLRYRSVRCMGEFKYLNASFVSLIDLEISPSYTILF
jgi:hypothetical protein